MDESSKGEKIMTESQYEDLTRKLDMLTRLSALSLVSGT